MTFLAIAEKELRFTVPAPLMFDMVSFGVRSLTQSLLHTLNVTTIKRFDSYWMHNRSSAMHSMTKVHICAYGICVCSVTRCACVCGVVWCGVVCACMCVRECECVCVCVSLIHIVTHVCVSVARRYFNAASDFFWLHSKSNRFRGLQERMSCVSGTYVSIQSSWQRLIESYEPSSREEGKRQRRCSQRP